MRGEFYKMEYEAWDEGTDTLSLEQEGAYLRFCHQMYRRKSAVVDDKMVLSRLWKCHPNKAAKLRDDLIAAGKITPTGDGHLTNTRVTQELDTRETQSRHRADAGRTGGTRSGEIRRNTLKNNDVGEALASKQTNQRRGEENREDIPSETSSLRDAGQPARVVAKPASERDQFVAVLSGGITPERAATIADYRKRQKWPLSAQSARLMVKNLIACGDPNAGADLVIERGWRGFEPSWLGRNQDPRAGPTGSRDAPPRLRGSDRLLSTMNGMFDDDQPATSAQPTLRLGAHSTADEA